MRRWHCLLWCSFKQITWRFKETKTKTVSAPIVSFCYTKHVPNQKIPKFIKLIFSIQLIQLNETCDSCLKSSANLDMESLNAIPCIDPIKCKLFVIAHTVVWYLFRYSANDRDFHAAHVPNSPFTFKVSSVIHANLGVLKAHSPSPVQIIYIIAPTSIFKDSFDSSNDRATLSIYHRHEMEFQVLIEVIVC